MEPLNFDNKLKKDMNMSKRIDFAIWAFALAWIGFGLSQQVV